VIDHPRALRKDTLASPEWQRRIDDLATSLDIPGAQVGVVALNGNDADIRVLTTGVASRGHGTPVTARTLFHFGSITKVWTTTLLMQLVEEGAITLNTTIAEVLPEARTDREGATAEITVRHLLSHTSGIEGDFFRITGENDDALGLYMQQMPQSQSVTDPGGPISYCNFGFSIAGAIAAERGGALWDDLIAARIVARLGITDMLTRSTDAGLFETAVGHAPGADGQPAAPVPTWQLPRSLGPAGLIAGTADTLLKFAAAHLRDGLALSGERILSAESAIAMRQPQSHLGDASTTLLGWGLGWTLADWGTPVVLHTGSTIGQTSSLVLLPEFGIAFCTLTNAATGPAFIAKVETLLANELGLTRPLPREDPHACQDAVRSLIGKWRTPWLLAEITENPDAAEGGVVVSLREGPAIEANAPAQQYKLQAAGGNRFLFERFGLPAEIARVDHDGREFLWAGRLLERVHESAHPDTSNPAANASTEQEPA